MPAPTSTPTAASLSFTPHLNAYCRLGPDSSHNSITLAMKGQAYPIDGRNLANSWFYIMISPQVGCWVPGDVGTPSGDTARVRVLIEIPTPTFTLLPAFNCGQFTNPQTCSQHPECTWNRQVTPGVCQNK
jgi:hypothetical protein